MASVVNHIDLQSDNCKNNCENVLNTQTNLHSDKCNQKFEHNQNINHRDYQVLSDTCKNSDACNLFNNIPGFNPGVRNVGGSSRGYNISINNENKDDLVNTENWLFNLNRTLSNCPNLNDPRINKMCKNNQVNSIPLYGQSTRITHPLYYFRAVDVYKHDMSGRDLNRNGNIHTLRPIANAISIGVDTVLAEKDNHKNIKYTKNRHHC